MEKKLLEDVSAGEPITRSLWPAKYKDLGIRNLYRYELPGGRRACYSIEYVDVDLGNCPFILDILTHPEYDRLFGYE